MVKIESQPQPPCLQGLQQLSLQGFCLGCISLQEGGRWKVGSEVNFNIMTPQLRITKLLLKSLKEEEENKSPVLVPFMPESVNSQPL